MSLLAFHGTDRDPDGRHLRVERLTESDRPELLELIDRDPLVNAVADVRIRASRDLGADRFVGMLLGVRGPDLALRAAALDAGNLLPIGGGPAEWTALAGRIATMPRKCSSIVGRADAVAAMWDVLSATWPAPRAVRGVQPLLVLDRGAIPPERPSDLRLMRMADLDRYLPAAAAMFTEELGIAPERAAGRSDYRRRVASLIAAERSFGVIHGGEVVFKADLGTVSSWTCQVQGVWVRPDLRGRGIATAAMGDVLTQALATAPTVSLYVNDFNLAARRLYARLGMTQAAELSTILF